MRILHRYVATDYLITFGLTLAIFTFVMCVGFLIRILDLVAQGVSIVSIAQVFVFNIPYILMFSVPISCITSVLLVLGRLSIDGEITAMKSAGLSLWQIVAPVIFISILLSFFCVYLNSFLAPQSRFARRQALVNIGVTNPVNLLEEGRFIKDIPGYMIYIRSKSKERVGGETQNKVHGVVAYEMDMYGVKRIVRAKEGVIKPTDNPFVINIDLYHVRMDQPDKANPLDPVKSEFVNAKFYPLELDFTDIYARKDISKKVKDMTFTELTQSARNIIQHYPGLDYEALMEQRMKLVVEANKRLALSISCFAFTLVGIPLALRSKRKDSSRGVGMALVIVFGFYFFIILAEALVESPQYRPDLIVWLPVVVGEVLGFVLMQKVN